MARPGETAAGGGGSLGVVPKRGRAGFFRVGRDEAGRWWLLDPAGEPFFVKAVHDVGHAPTSDDGALPRDAAAQLRAWGFNAVGVAGAAGPDDGLPFMGLVDFCAVGRVLLAPGLRLPDVFDAEWPRRAAEHATRVCLPLADQPALLGWVTDNALGWAQRSPRGRPTLLQLCLSLEPAFAAYHAAWEFVLALHAGRLEALARAWGVPLQNKEVVRELTRSETGLATRGYARDDARWTRELARRYFVTTSAAVRAADANHLVLGCRFRQPVGAEVLAECVYPAVDVAMPEWRELPPAGPAGALHPMLAGEVGWGEEESVRAPATGRGLPLTSVERMLRRARAALKRVARHPAAVGYGWSQWQDGPGEQPPFARGLLHLNGTEAREHTELLEPFNRWAESSRRKP